MKIIISLILILINSAILFSQTGALKSEAIKEMQAGRYGEAIDLLNRYISASPQEAEGYNLRGLCYEKRNLYEMAVYDFRSARKLKPENNEINLNLSRVTDSWYKLLYNKIEGHKREIAINPGRINNYLEIGKSYKNLGEWLTAEEWYDKYLKLEEPSSDEVIRYTEILAKNNHINKGEPILKRFTEKYPTDHRIWSRYGYFVLWLGKTKLAINAFEKALEIRPFFKEAMDGLDQAKGKGYIYTINDTSYNKRLKQQEYAIDKYYRQLKKDPSNNTIRQELITELIKVNRFEEALTQSNKLKNSSESTKYSALIEEVQNKRNDFLNRKISEYSSLYQKNPNDYEVVLNLADYYGRTQNFDSSNVFYALYLDKNPDDKEVRYNYIKSLASVKDFQDASDNMNILMQKEPENVKYRLLQNQLWVWTNSNIDQARIDLKSLLDKDNENPEIISVYALASIRGLDFNEAELMINKLQKISSDNESILSLQDNLEFAKLRAVQDSLWANLEIGRKIAENGNCNEALSYYEDYLSKASPNILIKKEYADVLTCAKDFDKAISIYDEVLNEQYNTDADIGRAKAYFYKGDSIKALSEFTRLRQERPKDLFVNLYLVDVYQQFQDLDRAKDILDSLNNGILDSTIEADTSQIKMVNLRYKWLGSGASGVWGNIGSSFALSPFTQIYSDNLNFLFSQTGGRLDMSVTGFLGVGAFFSRSYITSPGISNVMNTFKATVFVRILQDLIFSGSTGAIKGAYSDKRKVSDAAIKYEKTNYYQIYGAYEYNDARILLFSPNLINHFHSAKLFNFGGYYFHKSGFRLSGMFQYFRISDGNEGNHFQVRIGRKFDKDFYAGYEYDYQNFGYVSKLYYSPKNIQSHSIWGEWKFFHEQDLEFTIGGKFGYIPSVDFIIGELFGEVKYMPFPNFTLSGKTGWGSSYRYDTSYNSYYLNMSAYWSF